MSPIPSVSPLALHGWTPVPVDPAAIFLNAPYINKPASLLVSQIPFPSDPLVARIQSYVKSKLPLQTYHHSMRVYYWATAILFQQFPSCASSLSLSTLALTCLLHDIGTTHENLEATHLSFEYYGGYLALDLLQNSTETDAVATKPQAEAVAEAIIRHQDLGTVGRITFLGQLIQLATIYDNVGNFEEMIHVATRVDVNKAFPRGGWSKCFGETIREELRLKPWAHTTHLGEDKFREGVVGNALMKEYDDWE
ncbi:hypothetical protein OQA88_2907 [Cercophora sp. LCS_1]